VAVEIAEARGLSFAFQILRGSDGNDGGLADLSRDKARVRKGAITNGEVDAFYSTRLLVRSETSISTTTLGYRARNEGSFGTT
jgi:hypothetical protein